MPVSSVTSDNRKTITLHSQIYADNIITANLHPNNALNEEGDITFSAAVVTLTQGQTTIYVNSQIIPTKAKSV